MMLIMASGCSNKETSSESSDIPVNEKGSYLVSKKPVDMTIYMHYNDGAVVFSDDWPTFKEAAKMTNVNLKGVAPKTSTASNEAFNLMLASGEVPDVVMGKKQDMNKYGKEGAFLPLDDLIKEHAPHIQKYLEEMEGMKASALASDGKMYYIPFIADGEAQQGWFIRKDWLDKFNLEIPKTTDDLYKAMKTFLEKDANGNGQKDEIPYFSRIPTTLGDIAILW